MPRNKLIDLNNHLFEQLERLNDEGITGGALKDEIARSKAVASLATSIVNNANLGLQAEKLKNEYGHKEIDLPAMLKTDDKT